MEEMMQNEQSTENSNVPITAVPLMDLQKVQYKHDAGYHPDILALGTIDRVKHMALHTAKYASRFAAAQMTDDEELFQRTLVDSFIIALSTANTLTYDLEKAAANLDPEPVRLANRNEFAFRYLEQVGHMAKACESIDHLEDFPFRPEIVRANTAITRILSNEAERRAFDLQEAYHERIKDVEKRSGFSLFAAVAPH